MFVSDSSLGCSFRRMTDKEPVEIEAEEVVAKCVIDGSARLELVGCIRRKEEWWDEGGDRVREG